MLPGTLMSQFIVTQNRDAYFVIRGFRYQVDLTIIRWLTLRPTETLELEFGEDIDIVSKALSDPSGEAARTLEQVKHFTQALTLRSAVALRAVANAVDHRLNNPDAALFFRLCTNADTGTERPSPYDDRRPAIEVWEAIRRGEIGDQHLPNRLAGIRSILTCALKPAKIAAKTWKKSQNFIAHASEDDLLAFIRSFEWSARQPGSNEAEIEVCRTLREHGQSPDDQHASELHARLFLRVFKLLSNPGVKRLTPQDLTEQVKLPTLSQEDRALLNIVVSRVLGLEERVATVERQVQENKRAIAAVQVRRKAQAEGIVGEVCSVLAPVDITLPPKVKRLCHRRETVDSLIKRVDSATWTALHGSVGTGKTQMSILLAEATGGHVVWISLRDRKAPETLFYINIALKQITRESKLGDPAKLVENAAQKLGPGALIILDDLPRLDGSDDLSRKLVQLVHACQAEEVKIISTSYYPIPPAITDRLGSNALNHQAIPPFTVNEAAELFAVYGAPESFRIPATVHDLSILARGHPTILAAMARYLAHHKWRFDRKQLVALEKHGHAEDFINETVRRLLLTVEDKKAKQLLYRLCLVLGCFRWDEVLTVSRVRPCLERPRERLNPLLGLWVEQQGADWMTVCPLVKPLSQSELSSSVHHNVHLALADRIVAQQRLSVLDVIEALYHLKEAELYDRAAVLLILAFSEALTLPDDQVAELLSVSWVDCPLPTEMDLGLRMFLRSHQIKVTHRLGGRTEKLLDDVDRMIDLCSDTEDWAVSGLTVLISAVAKTDFGRAMKYLAHTIRAYQRMAVRRGKKDILLPEGFAISDLIWLYSTDIETPDDLLRWLEVTRELSAEDRRRAFDSHVAETGCQIAVNRLWMKEDERPPDQQDWRAVLDGYDRVIKASEELGFELVWALATAVKIVVLAEYLNDIDSALRTAEQAASRDSLSLRSEFLIAEVIGRQLSYKKRYGEALVWLNRAMDVGTDAFPGVRYQTYLETSKVLGESQPAKAVAVAQQAVQTVRLHPNETTETNMVRALGELAIAYWLNKDLPRAFEAFDEAAERLLACKEDSIFWKQLFVVFGHVSGYLSKIAWDGQPPLQTEQAEAYVPPFRGILMIYLPERADLYEENRLCFIFPQMAMFAEAVGNDERSGIWALRGIDVARRAGVLEAIAALGQQALAPLLLHGRYAEAIDAAVESCVAVVACDERRKQGSPCLESGLVPTDVLGPKPNDLWKFAEHQAVPEALIPLLFCLGKLKLSNPTAPPKHAREVQTICREVAMTAADRDLWESAAKMLETIFGADVSWHEVHQQANAAIRSGHDALGMIGYIGISLRDDAPLHVSVTCQAVVMSYLSHIILNHKSSVYRRILLPFLSDYWQSALRREPFRFIAPDLVADTLRAALEKPLEQRAQAILNTILDGLGVRLSPATDDAKTWLRGVS